MYYNPLSKTILTSADLVNMKVPTNLNEEDLLQKHSLVRLVDSQKPEPGDYEMIVEIEPSQTLSNPLDENSSKIYTRRYEARDLFQSPRTMIDGTVKSVAELKLDYLEKYIKVNYKNELSKTRLDNQKIGFVTRLGFHISCDFNSLSMINHVKSKADENPNQSVLLPATKNVVSLTRQELLSVLLEIEIFNDYLIILEKRLSDKIDASTTSSEASSVKMPLINDHKTLDEIRLLLSAVLVGDLQDILIHFDALPNIIVPKRVSMRQARLALLSGQYLSQVQAIIDSLPSPDKEAALIEWEYGQEVNRNSQLVALLQQSLGLTDEQIDALFIIAWNFV